MSMIGNFALVSAAQHDELLRAPESIHSFLEAATDVVDVDKAWHALHFLLTGTAWEGTPPLDFIAVGGEPVGDEDVGYGPARLLSPALVVALDSALASVTVRTLVANYDGAKMEVLEIYPGGWKTLDPKKGDEFGYFSGAYEEIRALVSKGAKSGSALLIWLT